MYQKAKYGIPQDEMVLEYHLRKYLSNKEKLSTKRVGNFKQAKQRLMENKIKCFKYNYSFDSSVQNFNNYEGTI